MAKKFYITHPLLKDLIQFVAINGFEPDDVNYIPVMPDGTSGLVISTGSPYERLVSEMECPKLVAGSHFVGIKSKRSYVKPNSGMRTVTIRFRPGALPYFLRTDLRELMDDVVDADQLFGVGIRYLEEQLAEDDNPVSVVARVEAFLLSRLDRDYDPGGTFHQIKTVYANPDNCQIEDLWNGNGGYKRLQRDFVRTVGLPPKLFIDIVRFNYSTSLLLANPWSSFTEVGYKAGYYDQSHFIRAFKQKAGFTPGKFLQQKSNMFLDNQRIIAEEFAFPGLLTCK